MKNEDIKKILIIRTDYLGDMLTITPVITSLQYYFPQAEIKALVNSLIGQEVLKHQHVVREIYRFPPQKPARFKDVRQLMCWLRHERFDLILSFATRDNRLTLLNLFSGAKRKIGFDIGLLSRFTYSPLIPNDKTRHEVERNLDFIYALDLEPVNKELVFEISDLEKAAVDKLWQKLKLGKQVIGLHPCSKRPVKNWPIERFQALAEKLINLYGVQLVFTGGKEDFEAIERIRFSVKSQTYNLAGQTTLGELAALILRFKMFITIDSGPMHLAAALKVPQVALFGAGEIKKWYPWGDKEINRVVYKEVGCQPCSLLECESIKCMQSITIEDVLDEVAQLWIR